MNKAITVCPPEHFGATRDPGRGFYSILRFTAGDDPSSALGGAYLDPGDSLVLVEVNLCRFREGALSDEALASVRGLFDLLSKTDRQLIVRFLYDWDGNCLATEPKTIDTVLLHVSQIAPVVKEYSRIIYTLQGLFIGKWGEMHGSRFLRSDHLKRIFAALRAGVGDGVSISVRTPAHWRAVTGYSGAGERGYAFTRDSRLPALFNDGMLGSESDLGTYPEGDGEREKALAFQDALCRLVPNGGEVISGSAYSEPDEAVKALSMMHVSYLNREHDAALLEKWKDARVTAPGAPETSFFELVGRRLGYRFVVTDAVAKYSRLSRRIKLSVTVRNRGFAPVYFEVSPGFLLAGKDGERVPEANDGERVFEAKGCERVYEAKGGDLRDLCGDAQADALTFTAQIPAADLAAGEYDIFFRIFSEKYDRALSTANEGSTGRGCLVGRFIKK